MKRWRLKAFLAIVGLAIVVLVGMALFYPTITADYNMIFYVSAIVVDKESGMPIEGADIRFTNPQNGVQWPNGTTSKEGRADRLHSGVLYGRSESEWQFRYGAEPDFEIKIDVLKEGYEPATRLFRWSRLPGGDDDKLADLGRVELTRLAAPAVK